MKKRNKIGILDLQGGVIEHLDHFARLGIEAVRIKRQEDLKAVAGLVIPGGESTCLYRLLKIFKLDQHILDNHRQGMKIWGTCAGAILVATDVIGEGPKLGVIDMTVERNAFGSQLDSFTCLAAVPAVGAGEIPLTFIRAPKIQRVGDGVTVLLRIQDYIAMAESDQVLVTVFHPELTPCLALHRYFARKCGLNPLAESAAAEVANCWTSTSWTKHARI